MAHAQGFLYLYYILNISFLSPLTPIITHLATDVKLYLINILLPIFATNVPIAVVIVKKLNIGKNSILANKDAFFT
jgi:hypothetical protein